MEIWQNTQINDLPNEIWKPIKNYEGSYEISNMGRVKTLERRSKTKIVKENKILTLKQSQFGYIQTKLNKNSKFWMPIVSRLVAEHFCNPPEYKWVANHINCVRWDNRAENLECISQSQNMRYAYRLGRKSQNGEKNHQAKITMEIAKSIRRYKEENDHLSNREIGLKFGLAQGHIKDIVNYKSWKE